MKTVVVVAAHADDEVLGCGGAIAKHVAAGDKVHAIFLADGVTSRLSVDSEDLKLRMLATETASRILGISTTAFLGLPDNCLDSIPLIDVIRPLESIFHNLQPEIVYTHHYGDLNVDHRVAHHAVMTACRPVVNSTVKDILAFEVMSSTEWQSPGLNPFLPNMYIDISLYLDRKMEALEAYAQEMRAAPHSRSLAHLRYLAYHRGHSIGVSSAEAFVVLRQVR